MEDYDDEELEDVEFETRPTEGVRIVGATEAGELARRDASGSVEPPLLSAPGEPATSGVPDALAPPAGSEMPHWTEPATGEVPEALTRDDLGGEEASQVAGPTWSDEQTGWRDDFDHSVLADAGGEEESRSYGALRPEQEVLRLGSEDPESEMGEEAVEIRSPALSGETSGSTGLPGMGSVVGGRRTVRIDSSGGARSATGSSSGSNPPTGSRPRGDLAGRGGDRNVAVAIAVGLAIGAVIVVLFLFGSASALLVATVAVTMAVAEYFAVMRKAGYKPASLLGLVGTICLMVAAYEKGEAAVIVVMAVVVVFTLLWYLWGVDTERPSTGVAVTLLGFLWVSFLGSFGALLLSPSIHPQRHGVALLFGAITATVAYDVAAYAIGSKAGSHPLAPRISPKKTWEGLAAGIFASVFVSVVFLSHLHPWSLKRSLALGVVVAVAAPLGDLCQSMIKRDVGVKDMSSALPGHGGMLDRIDAMLFVMPAVYFLARVLNIS